VYHHKKHWVEGIIDAEYDWSYIAQRKTNFHLLLNITLQNYSRKGEIAKLHCLLYNRLQPACVGLYHIGHRPYRPQTISATTISATNHIGHNHIGNKKRPYRPRGITVLATKKYTAI